MQLISHVNGLRRTQAQVRAHRDNRGGKAILQGMVCFLDQILELEERARPFVQPIRDLQLSPFAIREGEKLLEERAVLERLRGELKDLERDHLTILCPLAKRVRRAGAEAKSADKQRLSELSVSIGSARKAIKTRISGYEHLVCGMSSILADEVIGSLAPEEDRQALVVQTLSALTNMPAIRSLGTEQERCLTSLAELVNLYEQRLIDLMS
jgi:hypothetical protein